MNEIKSINESKLDAISRTVNQIVTASIAFLVVAATFALFYALLFKSVTGTSKDVILFVLGAVTAVLSQIISYYFGSSKTSDDKTKIINNLSEPEPK